MREFSVLLRCDPGLETQWVAHCLNWDLVSQGDSVAHALAMIVEAIALVIVEDSKAGLDPDDRPPAPDELWQLFASTQRKGTRLAAARVDSLPSLPRESVIAAVLYLRQIRAGERPGGPDELLSGAPPPFVVAALGEQADA